MVALGVLDGLAHQRRDDGNDQDGLRHHHGLEREQPAEKAQRAGMRKQQVDGQPDHHGRQRQRGVEQRQHDAAAAKARNAQPPACRHADETGQDTGRRADRQRASHDGHQDRIAGHDQTQRNRKAL